MQCYVIHAKAIVAGLLIMLGIMFNLTLSGHIMFGLNAVLTLFYVILCQSYSSWSINAVLSGIMFNLTLFYVIHAKAMSYSQSYSSWPINAVLSGIMFNLTLFYVTHAKAIVAGLLMQCYLVLCLTSHYSMSHMPKL